MDHLGTLLRHNAQRLHRSCLLRDRGGEKCRAVGALLPMKDDKEGDYHEAGDKNSLDGP